MSAAETHDTMSLVRRIAKGLTILIVEHDMLVVMELAQRIRCCTTARSSRGRAGRDPAQPKVLEVYLKTLSAAEGRDGALIRVDSIHTYYGKSHILHGVSLRSCRARSWGCSAGTAWARAPRSRPSWA